MVKKLVKTLAIFLAIVIVVSLIVGIWYFSYSSKGTFNVTITDKNNHQSLVNPDLPLNTFKAGEEITLSIWVSGNTNPFLTNHVSLQANLNAQAVTYFFTDSIGEKIYAATIPSGTLGYNCFLKIQTTSTGFQQNGLYQYGTPQGDYTVTVIGMDASSVEHQDSYSFSIVS